MSEWIAFVKQYAKKHNIPYRLALSQASKHYKGHSGGSKRSSSSSRAMLRKRRSHTTRKVSHVRHSGSKSLSKYRHAGKLLGGIAKQSAPKGALAALLSGLDARINIK